VASLTVGAHHVDDYHRRVVRIRARNVAFGVAAIAALMVSTSVEAPKQVTGRWTQPIGTGPEQSRPVVCIKGQFPFRALSAPADAEQTDDGPSRALRQALAGSSGLPGQPQNGWRRLSVSAGAVEFGHGVPPVLDGYVVVHSDNGQWSYEQSGGACIVRPFVSGGIAASWKLDPSATPPGASSTAFQVMVIDSQCASGRSPDHRLNEPQVRLLPDAIVVTFIADQLEGLQLCPSHPPAHRTVQLPERLGNRQLLDGGTVPAQPPCLRMGVQDCDR